jgi:hypothetical protein
MLQCLTSLPPWATASGGAGGEGGAAGAAGEVCTLTYTGGFALREGSFAGRCGDVDVVGTTSMSSVYCYYDVVTHLVIGARGTSDCAGCACYSGWVGPAPVECDLTNLTDEAQCVRDPSSGACTLRTQFPP